LIVAEVKERLTVSNQAIKKTDMERSHLKKLNEWEVKESIRLQSETSLQVWKT
jgi:hypothetical protein